MLANDQDFLLVGFSYQLEPYFTVYKAADGETALDQVIKRSPDFFKVVLLDVNMPTMGGIQVARKLQ